MSRTNFQELLDAGVHFGHLARKWNPKMAPYIFDQKNGIHIIDLHKSIVKIDEAADALKQLARSGRKVLFVATKKQAKDIVAEKAGIVKPGVPVVLGRNEPSVRAVVETRAREVGAPFFFAPDLADESEIPADFSLVGSFNRENAVTALAALKVLNGNRTIEQSEQSNNSPSLLNHRPQS